MIRLTITERGGPAKAFTFPKDDITIGRAKGNDVILPRNNISKRHTRVFRSKGQLVVRDLESTNGTFLNGRRIRTDEPLQAGDRIFLADFVLIIEDEMSAATPHPRDACKQQTTPPPLPPDGMGLMRPGAAGDEELSAIPIGADEIVPEPSEAAVAPLESLESLAEEAADEDEFGVAPEQEATGRRPGAPGAQAAARAEARAQEGWWRGAAGRTVEEPVPRPARPTPPSIEEAADLAQRMTLPTPPTALPDEELEPTPRPSPPAKAEPEVERRPEIAREAERVEAREEPAARKPPREEPAPRRPPREEPAPRRPLREEPAARKAALAEPETLAEEEVRARALARVEEVVKIESTEPALFGDPDLQRRIKSAIMDELFILESQNLIEPSLDRDGLVGRLTGALFGLGPLPDLASDPAVEVLVVYPDGSIFKRRGGKWIRETVRLDPPLVSVIARRLAAGAGIGRRGGIVEVFRVRHGDLPGIEAVGVCGGSAMRGGFVRLERPATFPADLERLADAGVLSVPMGTFLKMCIDGRQTVAVTGPAGSPRSALLRALVAALPDEERVVWMGPPDSEPPSARAIVARMSPASAGETILDDTDDSPLRVLEAVRWMQPGVLVIEAVEAARDAPLIDLVRTRMGAVLLGVETERYDPTLLGVSPLRRPSVPPPAEGPTAEVRLARLVDVVVEIVSLMDGSHRVRRIAERAAEEGDGAALTPIFEFVVSGTTEGGELAGEFRPTRTVPRFLEKRRQRGKRVDTSIFQG